MQRISNYVYGLFFSSEDSSTASFNVEKLFEPPAHLTFKERLRAINFQGNVPSRFIDHYLTFEMLEEPVRLDKLHVMEHALLTQWWQQSNQQNINPATRSLYTSFEIDQRLKQAIDVFTTSLWKIYFLKEQLSVFDTLNQKVVSNPNLASETKQITITPTQVSHLLIAELTQFIQNYQDEKDLQPMVAQHSQDLLNYQLIVCKQLLVDIGFTTSLLADCLPQQFWQAFKNRIDTNQSSTEILKKWWQQDKISTNLDEEGNHPLRQLVLSVKNQTLQDDLFTFVANLEKSNLKKINALKTELHDFENTPINVDYLKLDQDITSNQKSTLINEWRKTQHDLLQRKLVDELEKFITTQRSSFYMSNLILMQKKIMDELIVSWLPSETTTTQAVSTKCLPLFGITNSFSPFGSFYTTTPSHSLSLLQNEDNTAKLPSLKIRRPSEEVD